MPIVSLVNMLFLAYYVVIIVRIVISWFPRAHRNALVAAIGPTIYALTEPLLRPIRNALRPYQGSMPVDFSPIALWLLLSVVQVLVVRMLMGMGL